MPAVMLPAKRNRSSGVMESSLGRKEEEFSVEQVEAVIATLNGKVARLQKDIGAFKQTDGSHRRATTRRMPANLTYAKNVDDKSSLDEKKVAKGRRRESKSFSHDEALVDSPKSLSCRAATSNASTSTTKTTTTTTQQQQQQRKHALFNGQRKNRPQQPQEVNSQADDRQNTLYPNASDFALNATPPAENRKVLRKRISRGIQYDAQDCLIAKYQVRMKCFAVNRRGRSSGSKALRNETELGARSIANKEQPQQQQQQDRGAIPRNMDERQRRAGVSWRGIDKNEQQQRGGLRDTQRYAGVDERNRPPVVEPVTTPHHRSNLNEATDKPPQELSLHRDSGKLATGAPKSTHDKSIIKHAGQDEGKTANEATKKTKKTKKTTEEKANDQTIVDTHTPKVRSILNKNKSEDSNASHKKSKLLTIIDSKKSSIIINLPNIAGKSKNIPDENKSSTVLKQAHEAKSLNFGKRVFSKKTKNDKSQKIKNNTKSNDSIDISMKSKLSECTKELNQLIGKVSDLFRKKSNKSK